VGGNANRGLSWYGGGPGKNSEGCEEYQSAAGGESFNSGLTGFVIVCLLSCPRFTPDTIVGEQNDDDFGDADE